MHVQRSVGQKASDIVLAGLDRIRRIDGDDYNLLADRLAQLLGAQTAMSEKLTKAIACLDAG